MTLTLELGEPDEDDRPLSDMFREIFAGMPEEVRAKLPADGADQHDHYIYAQAGGVNTVSRKYAA
jgi:hypothetical protein